MKDSIISLFISFILIIITSSCATSQKSLTTIQTNNIKKIGLIVTQTSKDLEIIDHTKNMPHSYTGYQYGAIGGLIEGTIIGVQSSTKISKSLGGDPEILRKKLNNLELTRSLRNGINSRLSKQYEVVPIDRTTKENDQLKLNIDTLLEVGFIYGLAAYEAEKASPAIVADLRVTDISTRSTLIKKRILSDNYYRNNNVVEKFASNDAELFKSSIKEAVELTSILVVSEFGIDKNEIPTPAFTESINFASASCKRPYKLTEDCSWWTGATRKIEINGVKAKIAGTSDGKIILLMSGSHTLNSIKDALTLGIGDTRSSPTHGCLEVVKSLLQSMDIKILKVIKLVSYGAVDGYFLELSDDGYSILKGYSL